MTEQFHMLHGARRVLWVAFALALSGVVFATEPYIRVLFSGVTIAVALAATYVRLLRPTLTLSEAGYHVTVRGHRILSVSWSEVQRIQIDVEDESAYVDCGDRARNLVVPPKYGSPFTYTNRARLYEIVRAKAPAHAGSDPTASTTA